MQPNETRPAHWDLGYWETCAVVKSRAMDMPRSNYTIKSDVENDNQTLDGCKVTYRVACTYRMQSRGRKKTVNTKSAEVG